MFVFFLFFFPLSNFLGLFPLDKLLIESASFVLPPPWNGDKFFPSRVLLIINGLIGKRFIVLPLNSNWNLNSEINFEEKFTQTRIPLSLGGERIDRVVEYSLETATSH